MAMIMNMITIMTMIMMVMMLMVRLVEMRVRDFNEAKHMSEETLHSPFR